MKQQGVKYYSSPTSLNGILLLTYPPWMGYYSPPTLWKGKLLPPFPYPMEWDTSLLPPTQWNGTLVYSPLPNGIIITNICMAQINMCIWSNGPNGILVYSPLPNGMGYYPARTQWNGILLLCPLLKWDTSPPTPLVWMQLLPPLQWGVTPSHPLN